MYRQSAKEMNRQPAVLINIAKEFSIMPAGPKIGDGAYSGEHFRTNHLLPCLLQYNLVKVCLDGTLVGYASSWLKSAFGGLIDVDRLDPKDLRARLSFVSDEDPTLIEEIWEYIG